MDIKVISQNRKAFHEYTVSESFEAGLELRGSEIKSIRAGRVNISDAYARPESGELWLLNSHIATYDPASIFNHHPERPRKLLLHRKQINYLVGKTREKGLTLVPLKLFLKDGLAKIELGVARGKKLYDKREAIAKREEDLAMRRALKHSGTRKT